MSGSFKHAVLDATADRLSDEQLRGYKDAAGRLMDPEQVRAVCREARVSGMKVVPACDNHDAEGYCLGHEMPTDTAPAKRAAADRLFDMVTWVAVEEPCLDPEGVLPHVTHNGVLKLDGVELHCYQLSDGRRIFDKDDVDGLFGASEAEVKASITPLCCWVDSGIAFRAMHLRGPAVRVQFQCEPGESWFGMFDALIMNASGHLKLTDWNSFDKDVDAAQGKLVARAQDEIAKALA